MVLRDHQGTFLAGNTLRLADVGSVFESEAMGVREALTWIKDQELHTSNVTIKIDSMLTVPAIKGEDWNCLEVKEVIEECK